MNCLFYVVLLQANIPKPKNPIKLIVTNSSQSQSTENDNTTQDDASTQFQLELYWCIQQLERNIISEKLNPRQGAVHNMFLLSTFNLNARKLTYIS